MATDIRKTDYISYIEEYLPQQFDSAENTKTLLSIFLEEDQKFQDELEKLFNVGIDIDSATGYQLEVIGKLSGLPRTNIDDAIYRADIKFKQTIDNSSGTLPEILNFVKVLTNINAVRVIQNYPAAFITQIEDGDNVFLDIADRVANVAASGINAHSVIHLEGGYGVVPCENEDLLDEGGLFKREFIPEGDQNWKATLPETLDVYYSVSCAGESVMQAGEPKALSSGLLRKQEEATRGRIGETYTNSSYI